MNLLNSSAVEMLPEPVRALAERLGCESTGGAPTVRLSQIGRLRSGANASWTQYRASQTIASDECRFSWIARTGLFGLVRIEDALDHGAGRLTVTALGCLPVMRAPTCAALDRSEMMRYLAEIVWAPDAILRNRQLQWDVSGDRFLAVSCRTSGPPATVTFALDENGRIAVVKAADRPMFVAGGFRPACWFGRVFDYRRHAGYWLPFRAAVGWEIDGQPVVCWEGQLVEWVAYSEENGVRPQAS